MFTVTQHKPLSLKLIPVFSLPQLCTITVEKHSPGYNICCNPDSGTCVVSLFVHTTLYYPITEDVCNPDPFISEPYVFMGINIHEYCIYTKNTYKKFVVA